MYQLSLVDKNISATTDLITQQVDLDQTDIQNRIIRIKKLKCQKNGIDIFDGIDLTFMSNRINTIIGKNGSGKSTLLKILANYENSGLVSGNV
jgi:ABC-type molybdenum transport system ATPase subunit/photorepair protein PhrA